MRKPKDDKPAQPLLKALQETAAEGSTKSAAFHFLKKDLRHVASEEDLLGAYHGLNCATQILAPQSDTYRRSLGEMRKILDGIGRVVKGNSRRMGHLVIWFNKKVAPHLSAPHRKEAAEALCKILDL